MSNIVTAKQYDAIIKICKDIFIKKTKDYGTAWRILRLSSITDQIFIKAKRIRSIDTKGIQKVNESIEQEYIGIVNYCIIALIQLQLKLEIEEEHIPLDQVIVLFDHQISQTKNLMEQKNHDYGEVWREMRVSSITDLILMKILRIKQIEDNKGKTLVSEGIDANYSDIINYAVFALIRLKERKENRTT